MIVNAGWDPLTTAAVIGLLTCVFPTAFFEIWGHDSVGQALNAAIVFALTFLGWGFTSHPLIPTLIVSMFFVAYGVNQLADNLIAGVLAARHTRKSGNPAPLTTAGVEWETLDWKE